MQLANHLQNIEAEKHKLHSQVKRLCQENAWLRDELGLTQKKVHKCEQTIASYLNEIEHLKFFKDIKLFDLDNEKSEINTDSNNQQDMINDLFPLDDNDDEQDYPTQSVNGYEISTRLKTLHNLVIQYASQGRYEIAVPLCRQALEDLEKISGHQRKKFLLNNNL